MNSLSWILRFLNPFLGAPVELGSDRTYENIARAAAALTGNAQQPLRVPIRPSPSPPVHQLQKRQQQKQQLESQQDQLLQNRAQTYENQGQESQKNQQLQLPLQQQSQTGAPPVPAIYSNSFDAQEEPYDDLDDDSDEWDDDIQSVADNRYSAENNLHDRYSGQISNHSHAGLPIATASQVSNTPGFCESTASNEYYPNMTEGPDPFDTSHIRCYDEPPLEIPDAQPLPGNTNDSEDYNVNNAMIMQNAKPSANSPASTYNSHDQTKNTIGSSLNSSDCSFSGSSVASLPLRISQMASPNTCDSSLTPVRADMPVTTYRNTEGNDTVVSTDMFPMIHNNTSHMPGPSQIRDGHQINNVRDLNAQISNMWISSIAQPQSVVPVTSSPLSSALQNRQEHTIISPTSSSWMSNEARDRGQNRQVAILQPTVAKPQPVLSNLSPVSNQPGQLALPAPLTPKNVALPKLDRSFIAELEKSLGKDQASANTFNTSDKKINNAMRGSFVSSPPAVLKQSQRMASEVPALPPPQQAASSRSQQQLAVSRLTSESQVVDLPGGRPSSHSQFNTESLNRNSAFSDLDVLSSSKTLGLLSEQTIDTGQYFPKTAHVRPFLQQPQTTGQNMMRGMASGSIGNFATFPRTSGSAVQQNSIVSAGSVHPDTSKFAESVSAQFQAVERWSNMEDGTKPTPAISNLNTIHPGFQMNYSWQQPSSYRSQIQSSQTSSIQSASIRPWNGQFQQHQQQSIHQHHTQQMEVPHNTVIQPTVVLSPQLTVNYNQVSG